MLKRFEIVHVHGNNYGDLAVDGSLPLSLEITFVHRSIETRPAARGFGEATRLELDAPNDPNRPDYLIDLPGINAVSEMPSSIVV